jgi:hypothetical protein
VYRRGRTVGSKMTISLQAVRWYLSKHGDPLERVYSPYARLREGFRELISYCLAILLPSRFRAGFGDEDFFNQLDVSRMAVASKTRASRNASRGLAVEDYSVPRASSHNTSTSRTSSMWYCTGRSNTGY